MAFYPFDFRDRIALHGVGKFRVVNYKVLFLPPQLVLVLPFQKYPRLRLEGEIAEVPVGGAWIPAGDERRYFIILPAIKSCTGSVVGDEVEMRFRIDDQDHVDVPEVLQLALSLHSTALLSWEKLTPGKQRMFVQHVKSAKTANTQRRRVDEALTAIGDGISIRDLQSRKKTR